MFRSTESSYAASRGKGVTGIRVRVITQRGPTDGLRRLTNADSSSRAYGRERALFTFSSAQHESSVSLYSCTENSTSLPHLEGKPFLTWQKTDRRRRRRRRRCLSLFYRNTRINSAEIEFLMSNFCKYLWQSEIAEKLYCVHSASTFDHVRHRNCVEYGFFIFFGKFKKF